VRLDQGPRVHGVRPAVDVALTAAAEVADGRVACAILTGMGRDGLAPHGLARLHPRFHTPMLAQFVLAGWSIVLETTSQVGPAAVRLAWFPIFYFVFMVPLPGPLVDAMTGPLKQWISAIVVESLWQVGYPISRSGVVVTDRSSASRGTTPASLWSLSTTGYIRCLHAPMRLSGLFQRKCAVDQGLYAPVAQQRHHFGLDCGHHCCLIRIAAGAQC